MVSILQAVVSDVEAAVIGGDPERRRAMLRSVSGLFVGQAADLSEEQVAAFDVVIVRLARDIETNARAELAEQLADVTNAPSNVVRDLALDASVVVAGPVLERSTRLDENDLVLVAEKRGQGHLMAITRRTSLSERVTDVLVTRGDRDVVRSVADNDGARFSEVGHRTLVTRASHDSVLQASLTKRADIPPAYRKRLVELAQARAQQSLGAEFNGQAAATDAVSRAASLLRAPVRDNALLVAEVAVAAKARKMDLSEFIVCEWLERGDETEALVALARLAGVPSRTALQAYETESHEPLLILVRASKCGWRTLKLFLTAKTGRRPEPQEMQGLVEAFQALAVATAQRVARFAATQEVAQRMEAPVPASVAARSNAAP